MPAGGSNAPARSVVERFGRAAARYESWYETPRGARVARAEITLLEKLLVDSPRVGRVLEVGCGTGYFTDWLRQRYGRVVGLDRSAPMLRVLQGRGRSFPIVCGDAEGLPLSEASFDEVFFITTLEFLAAPELALGEAARVARSAIVVLWLNPWSLGGLKRLLTPGRLSSQAHGLTILRARRLLRRAAGSRACEVSWSSALFPWPFGGVRARLPFGNVLAMRLALAAQASSSRAGAAECLR